MAAVVDVLSLTDAVREADEEVAAAVVADLLLIAPSL